MSTTANTNNLLWCTVLLQCDLKEFDATTNSRVGDIYAASLSRTTIVNATPTKGMQISIRQEAIGKNLTLSDDYESHVEFKFRIDSVIEADGASIALMEYAIHNHSLFSAHVKQLLDEFGFELDAASGVD
jgi:hypothetical protein